MSPRQRLLVGIFLAIALGSAIALFRMNLPH